MLGALLQEHPTWYENKSEAHGPLWQQFQTMLAFVTSWIPELSCNAIICLDRTIQAVMPYPLSNTSQYVQAVRSFTLQPSTAAAHITALAQLAPDDRGLREWTARVLASAEGVLSGAVGLSDGASSQEYGSSAGSELEDGRASVALFTVGEVTHMLGLPVANLENGKFKCQN